MLPPAPGELLPGWHRQLSKNENCFESRSTQRGSNEDEFFAIRNWHSGDSLRHIHWRSSAKTGTPMVRQFESHSPNAIFLAADLFADDNKISNSMELESESRICETILSLLATVLQQWRTNPSQHLVVGIADHQATTHVANPDTEFSWRLHQRLAEASPCQQTCIRELIENCFANFSSSEMLLVLSSRPIPPEIRDLPIAERMNWVYCDHQSLENLFRSSGQNQPERVRPQAAEVL